MNMRDIYTFLCVLKDLELFVFEHEDDFLSEFCLGDSVMVLLSVYFASSEVKVYYILDCGQHVTDTIELKDFFEWRDRIDQQNKTKNQK